MFSILLFYLFRLHLLSAFFSSMSTNILYHVTECKKKVYDIRMLKYVINMNVRSLISLRFPRPDG